MALNRSGVPFGRSVGMLLQVFILDLFFFAWAVPLSLAYLLVSDTVALPAGVEVVGVGMAAGALAGAVALGRYPRPVVALLLILARWPVVRRFDTRIRGIARDYYRSSRAYRRTPGLLRATLNAVTAVHWLAAFVLLWGLLEIYGVDLSLAVTLALLNVLTLVSQFVPTPGGAGFVEAAVGLSVDSYAAGGSVAGALLLWRFFAFNIIFLFGPLAGWLLYLRAGGGARKPGRKKASRTAVGKTDMTFAGIASRVARRRAGARREKAVRTTNLATFSGLVAFSVPHNGLSRKDSR